MITSSELSSSSSPTKQLIGRQFSTESNLLTDDDDSSQESREVSYIRFMSSLPRLCSPTICGTANYKTPTKKYSRMTPLDQSFNWSIDQIAQLDPCDFSNIEDNFDFYRDIDERIVSKELDNENEWYFSQKKIIPSPKTPERSERVDPRVFTETEEMSYSCEQSSSVSELRSSMRSPEYHSISPNDLSVDCFKTPLNCSKSRQKKKLFDKEERHLVDTANSRSPKDSAFETIDSQNMFSPIYSPDWRKTWLSSRITHLSPICSMNPNVVDLDFSHDLKECDLNDQPMVSQSEDSFSNMTCDMLSIESHVFTGDESPNQCPQQQQQRNDNYKNNVLNQLNGCQPNQRFQTYFTKTSTPSQKL